MPLDNTASVRDIITSLQELEGINAKADLTSVVGSPATENDSMATITNTIQLAKNELADKTGQDNTEPLLALVGNAYGEFVKSVQSGTIQNLTSAMGTSYNIPINPVNIDKSVVSVDYTPAGIRYDSGSFIIDLHDEETLNLRRVNGGIVNSVYMTWTVIEYEDNVNVQKINTNRNSISTSIPIEPVNVNKTIPYVQIKSFISNANTTPLLHAKTVNLTTEAVLVTSSSSHDKEFLCQVVEFP